MTRTRIRWYLSRRDARLIGYARGRRRRRRRRWRMSSIILGGVTTIRATIIRRGLRTGLCVEGRKGITDIVTQIGEKVLARLL